MQFAYNNRLATLNKEFNKLEELHIKGLSIFGNKYKRSIVPFRLCKFELLSGLQDYIESLGKFNTIENKRSSELSGIINELGENNEYDYLSKYILTATNLMINSIHTFLSSNIFESLISKIKRFGLLKQINSFHITFPETKK